MLLGAPLWPLRVTKRPRSSLIPYPGSASCFIMFLTPPNNDIEINVPLLRHAVGNEEEKKGESAGSSEESRVVRGGVMSQYN